VVVVKNIVDSYLHDMDVEINPAEGKGKGTLRISSEGHWPAMVKRKLVHEKDEAAEALNEHGEEGFADFLRELAPYLETPLTVIAFHIDKDEFFGATQWEVKPG